MDKKIKDLLDKINYNSDNYKYFNDVKINKIVVSEDKNIWNIHLNCLNTIRFDILKEFIDKLSNYVNKKSPNSPILKNCLNAFWVGGLICSLGQLILSFCQYKGFDEKASGTIVSIILIGLSALLTSLNIFSLTLSKTIKLSSLKIVSSDIADKAFINFSKLEFFSNT